MKTTLKILLLLLVSATFCSCTKDAEYIQRLDPGDNGLVFNNSHSAMIVKFAPPFEDGYTVRAVSEKEFFGPLWTFYFPNIPYEMLGRTIDLTEKSDLTLSFDFYNQVEWSASPEGVSGVVYNSLQDKVEYTDESPFESGKMLLTEDETGITFVLRGVLKNGKLIRMRLFAPASPEGAILQ